MIAHSKDLRKRVINAVNQKVLQLGEIAVLFQINVRTIYDWRKQFEKTGNIEAKTGFHKGHSHKITDLEKFKKFVEENSDLTLKEMAEKWGNISPKTIDRALKKIGFTFKKNNLDTKSAMKKKEMNLKMKSGRWIHQ